MFLPLTTVLADFVAHAGRSTRDAAIENGLNYCTIQRILKNQTIFNLDIVLLPRDAGSVGFCEWLLDFCESY